MNGVSAVVASSGVVLVIGGTGGQGSTVIRRLREYGLPVRVLADEPTSGETQALRQRGVELVRGSLDDRASLDQALTGVDALFLVLDQTDAGPSGRLRRGKADGDAAKQAGVASTAEVADLLTRALHQEVRVTEVQVEGVFMLAETDEPSVDIPWLRNLYPQLHTLSSWLAPGGGLELCRRALARQAV
jgi:uncharacterized protein YbjT (DUF2867 family)